MVMVGEIGDSAMEAEQKYSFERIADLLISIKDSAFSFTVEIYNKEVQDVQMRGGHFEALDIALGVIVHNRTADEVNYIVGCVVHSQALLERPSSPS